jgi:hypothetical protein
MRTIKKLRPRTSVALTVLIVGGGLLFGPQAASAQTCIQDVWQAHGHSNELQCTANDVTLSSATNIQIITGGSCDPVTGVCSCDAGGTVTFTADFRMDMTATTRFDVGFYLATDGDPNNDGAITGQCTPTASLAGNTSNFVNLDAAPDVCGDITETVTPDNNPLFVRTQISAPCPLTPGQKLRLPFATTWGQPGANEVCDGVGNGTTTNDIFPGSPSKCNKGILELDIISRPTDFHVVKDYQGTGVFEDTGGEAVYNVRVVNDGGIQITLQSLTDDRYGNITQVHPAGGGFFAVTATTCTPDGLPATCEVGGTIAAGPGTECSCTFTGVVPPGDFPGSFPDVVTVTANNPSDPNPIPRSDDATVPYLDRPQPPTLTKAVANTQCQIDVTYNVVVTNGSAQDALTLSTLNDNVYGNITFVQGNVVSTTCALTQTIQPSGTYACSFVGRINSCNTTVMDTVSGSATDDDGRFYDPNTVPPFQPGSATVVVTAGPPPQP